VQDDVARHLKQNVSEKKDAGAEAVNGFAEPKLLLHRELRKADIDPVEIRGEVAEEKKGRQAQRDLAKDGVFGANVRSQSDGGRDLAHAGLPLFRGLLCRRAARQTPHLHRDASAASKANSTACN
jgi:hypothetical protein